MDDIPLPGLAPDPNPIEPSAEFPQLPVEGPTVPAEPKLPDEPPVLPALPENPPAPAGDPPAPPVAPSAAPEEAPVPTDGLVSFFQEPDAPKTDDIDCSEPVQGPQLDPNSTASFVSTANSTDQSAASIDGASNVCGENAQLQSTPNAAAPDTDVVGPQLSSVAEAQLAQPSVGDPAAMEISEAVALPLPSTAIEAYPVQYAEPGADPQQVVGDPTLQNSQVQYSAGYMGYPQISDPSMMHNYSYMANSYTDYMSMYHAGRMSRYPNTYASYQGYNYSYPHMPQMYDGRNMAAYATGSYSQPMLPGSATSMMSNFTPPLPTDYKAPSFSTEPPQAKKPNVDALADSELPPLPEGAMPEQPKEKVEAPPKTEDGEQPPQPPTEALDDDGSDRMVTDQDEPSDNFSEDVNRYSPSLPMDEDETNHQSSGVDDAASNRSASKSSVLGKAQAKKRLMAFSISKQAAAAQIAAKKQAQTTGRDKKENGDASGKPASDETSAVSSENVFDDKHSKKRPKKSSKMEKARETIEEIEEIKRNEMTTMMYHRQTLLNDSTNDHSSDRRRDRNRRRSTSYSRSRSRRSRSRSHDRKSRRGDKKYRRRSRTRSRSKSGSRSRSVSQVDKKAAVKTSDIKSWDDFVEAGFQLDRYRRVKFNENKNSLMTEIEIRKKEGSKHGRYRERRSTSIEKEVMEEYRKRKINMFEAPTELRKPLLCASDKGNADEPKEYPSHIVQYTVVKPTVKFCENPTHASLHFLNRVQLLESVPDDVAAMIRRFWSVSRPKRLKEKPVHQREDGERSPSVDEGGSKCPIRWWSSDSLREDGDKYIAVDEIEDDDEEIIPFMPYSETAVETTTSAEKPAPKLVEKPISAGVRKSRFEDATEEKPGVSVVVRSRWDSDYEDSPKNANDVDLSINLENAYRESPKVDAQVSRLNSEGPALPPIDDPHQSKPVVAAPPEETSVSTYVNKKHVLIERRPKKNKDKSKRSSSSKDIRDSSESKKGRKSKSSLSPDEWREETDYEPVEAPLPKEPKKVVEEEYAEDPFENDKSGEHKLVSEYEDFLKSVSLEPPKDENLPLYEGPKPPPQQEGPKLPHRLEKSNDAEEKTSKLVNRDSNRSPSSDTRMEVDNEEAFDVDKFFLKEMRMRKLAGNEMSKKKDDFVSEPIKKKDDFVNEMAKKKEDLVESDGEIDSDVETKRKKKRDKKEKPKKKKAAVKVKKLSAKNKRKQKEKKKKYESSSDSSDSSDDSDSDDSYSSDDSASSDSSSSSSSNSSSSDHSSSDSTSRKKRKRSKKVKKKDKKPERKSSDRSKKKKKKQKLKESESDSKKKRKKGSKNDDKKKKSKKVPTDNILELLAVSLKKTESEDNDVPKKTAKEKRKKRKKKSERDKDDKVANSLLDAMPAEVSREFSEEKILAKMKELEKASPLESKKKKKKSKRRRSSSPSEKEVPTWKKTKLIDPREIEESVAKAQMNPFFDDNLDDWDRLAAPSTAEHSMRDNSKNELENKDAKKKKKASSIKPKANKRGADKNVEKQREEKQKSKTVHKKKKKPASKKPKKKDDKTTFLDKENKRPSSPDERDSRSPSIEEPNFDESPRLAKDRGSDFDRSSLSPERTPACELPKCDTSISELAAQPLDVQPPTPSADRYSPTFCEEDNALSPAKRETFQEGAPFSTAPGYYGYQSTGLYSCFASTDLQNISLPTAVPQPVPAPLPVPPPSISHSFASSAAKDCLLVSIKDPLVSSSAASAAETSAAVCHSTSAAADAEPSPPTETSSTSDTETEPQAFDTVAVSEPDKGSYKSFSVGKLEVKTKAAKKFVHSNIFDSFEGEEQRTKPEPLTPTKTAAPESAESVDQPATAAEPPAAPEEDVEKEEFQARPCIALPELPEAQREATPAADRSPPPRAECTPAKRDSAADRARQPSSPEKRSRSRDRSARRRTDREDSHRDGHRRRSRTRTRTRSRSRSHSRSYTRYRKQRHFGGRDRYKRRSRSRSRSRSRRRSRDRDYKEHRYRHKRRSYSREPKKSGRRERTPPNEEPPPRPYDEQQPPPPPQQSEERARLEANYEAEYNRHYSEMRARDSVAELWRRLHDGQYRNGDLKPADVNMFQALLFQLRETLAGGGHQQYADSISALLAKLEAHKMEAAAPTLAPGDPRGCNAAASSQTHLFVQSMLTLCHQIQGSLPAVAAPPAEPKPRNAVGPRSPPDPYHSPLAKKSVADSTNGGYAPPNAAAAGAVNSRFEERSREISPKPLSLDERLELELGVPAAKKAPGPLPPAPHRAPPPMGMPPRGFYPMPMYENGVPNFSTPPPSLHFAAAPAVGPERGYYAGARHPPPISWGVQSGGVAPPPFMAPNMAKIPPPVMLPPPGMPPRAMPPLPSEPKVPYRVPDPAGSKVHSIQVGNVLQIVPTEVQPSSAVSSLALSDQLPFFGNDLGKSKAGPPATTTSSQPSSTVSSQDRSKWLPLFGNDLGKSKAGSSATTTSSQPSSTVSSQDRSNWLPIFGDLGKSKAGSPATTTSSQPSSTVSSIDRSNWLPFFGDLGKSKGGSPATTTSLQPSSTVSSIDRTNWLPIFGDLGKSKAGSPATTTSLLPSPTVSSEDRSKWLPLFGDQGKSKASRSPTYRYTPMRFSPLRSPPPQPITILPWGTDHLPISFAAAPAVSGSKAKTPNNSRASEFPSSNEPKLAKDTKTKAREAHQAAVAPLTVTPSPIGSSRSTISKLPLPPGTTDADLKKMIHLAREKRLSKLRATNDSPATPTSDDSSLVEDQENNDEPLAPISIKPSPEQGILISPGFKEKSTPVTALGRSIIGSSRKMVSFVDGVRPGAPTVSDSPPTKARKPSPPPKKKHKVRVKIIRPDDDSDDDDSPPPPPPGPPPPELYPQSGLAALALLPPGYILPKI